MEIEMIEGSNLREIRWRIGTTQFTWEPSISRGNRMSLFRRQYHEETFNWIGFYPTLEAAKSASKWRV